MALSRPTFSCLRCADRKVKCDRQRPCSACVKHGVDCIFNPNPSQATRKKHKRVKVQVLSERIRYYETLLQEQGIDPGRTPGTRDSEAHERSAHPAALCPQDLQPHTPSSLNSEPSSRPKKTQISDGQTRFNFVENSLWTRVVEESHDPENTLEDSNDSSDLELSEDECNFVLSSHHKSNSKPRHPTPERLLQLWDIFVENIDPLTKVVHVPTLQPAIQKAASSIGTIPRSFEALMFAIYAAAVMSLKDDECRQRFSEPRKLLLSRHICDTEVALSRAKVMGTTSLVVLQALVIHLFSVRDIYEPRAIWSLTGVAVRIAQVMGLERDGTFLGLPPFETEMRRRVWWQLKFHDFRTAELCGLAKFRDLDTGASSTKWPTNINDNQLTPGMSLLEAEENKLTDTVFFALRCDFTKFAAARIATFREQGKDSSHWNLDSVENNEELKQRAVKELEEVIEMKYLRYCDPSRPLHLLTMLMARYAMNTANFLTHHPRRWSSMEQVPPAERQFTWDVSINLLEQYDMAQTNPLLKRFAWHAIYFRQWHAFIHVLDTLRADPLKTDANKTWRLIGKTYENTPEMITDMKKPIHVAIGNLCLKAYNERESALRSSNLLLPPTPDFIAKLRQQREIAKAKRNERNARSGHSEKAINPADAKGQDVSASANIESGIIHVSDASQSTYLQQDMSMQRSSRDPTGDPAENNNDIDLFNVFGDSQSSDLDKELDLMLGPSFNMEDEMLDTITWEQWDAWLVDSNVMRPLSS